MTITAHTAIGAAIGHAIGNPVLGFILGLVSHYLIDIIPHGDTKISDNFRKYKIKRKQAVAYVTIDAACAIAFLLFLFNFKYMTPLSLPVSAGIAGSVLPDFLVGVYDITKSKYLAWHNKMHFYFHNLIINRRGDIPLQYAVVAQLMLISFLQMR